MQIDALQNTNCRGEISVYSYTKTADWRSPIPFWRVPIYILEAEIVLGCDPDLRPEIGNQIGPEIGPGAEIGKK